MSLQKNCFPQENCHTGSSGKHTVHLQYARALFLKVILQHVYKNTNINPQFSGCFASIISHHLCTRQIS